MSAALCFHREHCGATAERPCELRRYAVCSYCGTKPAAVNGLIYRGKRMCADCTAEVE